MPGSPPAPPLQPPLPIASAVAPVGRQRQQTPPPAYGAAVGVPAPTATAVAAPVAAPAAGVARADLRNSPFSAVMRWAPDALNPRGVGPEDVVAYFAMLQTVYGAVTNSVLLPEGLQALWAAAVYLKRFGRVTYKADLVSYTANGICSSVQPDGPSASPAMFVKFQVKSTADDLRLDAIGAIVMSKILEHEATVAGAPPFAMHSAIMAYADGFLGVLETYPQKPGFAAPQMFQYNLAQQLVEGRLLPVLGFFPSDVPRELQAAVQAAETRAAALGAAPGSDLRSGGADLDFAKGYPMPYLSLLKTENPNALLAPAVAFDAIDGISLRTLISRLTPTSDFSAVADRLSFVTRIMRVLGQYGWVHNDLHLENILYDRATGNFVLIDYGRTMMDPRSLPAEIRESADREMLKLDMLLHAKHLRDVADKDSGTGIAAAQAGRYTRFADSAFATTKIPLIAPQVLSVFGSANPNFAKSLFMYDLATMVLGIMKRATVPNAPAAKVAEDFARTFSDTGIAEMEGTRLLILDLDSLIAVLESPVSAGIPEHMNLMLLGILWTSMVLTAFRDDAVTRGVGAPLVYTVGSNGNLNTMITDFMELSAIGLVFIGGFQFQTPCVDERIMEMFPKIEGYIQAYFDTGFLVPPAAPSGAAIPGGAGAGAASAMRSVARSAAVRSRFAPTMRSRFAPGAARSARMRPIAWDDPKRPGDPLDPSVIAEKRRATPTAWARKALAEYVSPLRGLPAVFSIGADGTVAPAKIAGGRKKRGGAAAGGADPGELMRRVRALLQALPDPNAAKTARLIAELENTRPFVLGAEGARRTARS